MNAIAQCVIDEMQNAAQQVYEDLLAANRGGRNGEYIARMLASRMAGRGAMPERLGLTARQFHMLMARWFPGLDPDAYALGPSQDIERADETADLRRLILLHATGPGDEAEWIAELLSIGCLGSDHLWQDLGLWSRADLSGLIQENFPSLKAANDRDMKWKKFLYKQLCNAEGIYTCRSPSCEVCADYSNCFGPEE